MRKDTLQRCVGRAFFSISLLLQLAYLSIIVMIIYGMENTGARWEILWASCSSDSSAFIIFLFCTGAGG